MDSTLAFCWLLNKQTPALGDLSVLTQPQGMTSPTLWRTGEKIDSVLQNIPDNAYLLLFSGGGRCRAQVRLLLRNLHCDESKQIPGVLLVHIWPPPSFLAPDPTGHTTHLTFLREVLYINHFSHCWDKVSNKSNLRKEGQFESTVHQGEKSMRSLCIHSQEAESDRRWCSICLLFFVQSRTPAQEMLPLIKGESSTSINPT